jgi:hypothetical protein
MQNAKYKIEENKELLAMLNVCRLPQRTVSSLGTSYPFYVMHAAQLLCRSAMMPRRIVDMAQSPTIPGSQTREKGKKKTELHINSA